MAYLLMMFKQGLGGLFDYLFITQSPTIFHDYGLISEGLTETPKDYGSIV